jgi:hypothetical protein
MSNNEAAYIDTCFHSCTHKGKKTCSWGSYYQHAIPPWGRVLHPTDEMLCADCGAHEARVTLKETDND